MKGRTKTPSEAASWPLFVGTEAVPGALHFRFVSRAYVIPPGRESLIHAPRSAAVDRASQISSSGFLNGYFTELFCSCVLVWICTSRI